MSVLVGKYRHFRKGYPPKKYIPPTPLFKFCPPGVQHTVYLGWDSYLLVLGGGVLVCQGFLFLHGSPREIFSIREV